MVWRIDATEANSSLRLGGCHSPIPLDSELVNLADKVYAPCTIATHTPGLEALRSLTTVNQRALAHSTNHID